MILIIKNNDNIQKMISNPSKAKHRRNHSELPTSLKPPTQKRPKTGQPKKKKEKKRNLNG